MGEIQKAEILLTYVIEVPFTLSLSTPLPEEDTKAEDAIRTARFIVEQHGLRVISKTIHHRTVWGGILAVAKEEMVDAIVMGSGRGSPGEGIGHNVEEVIKRAECEVILDRGPLRVHETWVETPEQELVKT